MYFGRGTYDPEASNQAQSRLKEFSGATAISSNAYFGRPEDDEDESGPSGGGGHGGGGGAGGGDYLENETLAGLERNVRDAAGRFMQNPDVQNITDQIRSGALKVGSARRLWSSGFELICYSCPTIYRLMSNDRCCAVSFHFPLSCRYPSLDSIYYHAPAIRPTQRLADC